MERTNGRISPNRIFSIGGIDVEARKGTAQVGWIRMTEFWNVKLELFLPELSEPPRIPLWATRNYLHDYPNCSVSKKLTTSKKSI